MTHLFADLAGVSVLAGVALALLVAAWVPTAKVARWLNIAAAGLVVGGIVLSLFVSLHHI